SSDAPVYRVDHEDPAVSVITYQEHAAELAEIGWREGKSPGLRELAILGQQHQMVSAGIEDAYDAVLVVFFGEGSVYLPIEILNVKWRESMLHRIRVHESAAGQRYQIEVLVENVHPALTEVRRV